MIKFDESKIEENNKELVVKIIKSCDLYFEKNYDLLSIDSKEDDLLLPRRFAIYFIREYCKLSMLELADVFGTNFKGAYLDYTYIHEKVVEESRMFVQIVNDLKIQIFDDQSIYDYTELSNETSNDSEVVVNQDSINQSTSYSSSNGEDYGYLIESAISATNNSYAPYSNYYVGAALMDNNNLVYCGSNIENASYGLSMCAERVALYSAASKGVRNYKCLALVAKDNNGFNDYPIPCGACLQVYSEFCDESFRFILAKSPTDYIIKTLGELLPMRFSLESNNNNF